MEWDYTFECGRLKDFLKWRLVEKRSEGARRPKLACGFVVIDQRQARGVGYKESGTP